MIRAAAIMIGCVVALPVIAGEAERAKSPSLQMPVRLEDMPSETREAISKVVKKPTVTALGPAEEFVAHTDTYEWLLDHPDRTATAWRKLGVGAVEIKALKDGRFFWKDEGSELVWQSVAKGPKGRVWYAEGKVKPGPFLPTYPVTAVAVMNFTEQARASGDSIIKHQVEVFVHTDSKAAAMMTRLLGDSVPKMAQQGSEQLQMFFSGIAKYAHDKPEKAQVLFQDKSR